MHSASLLPTDPSPCADAAPTMVALSGGVDSAVALLRLAEAGVPVQAMFMKNWEEDDHAGHCTAAEDLDDARRVCDRLGVSLHTVNCSTPRGTAPRSDRRTPTGCTARRRR